MALALLSEVLNGVYSEYATRITPPVHASEFFKMHLHYSQLEEALEELDNVSALRIPIPEHTTTTFIGGAGVAVGTEASALILLRSSTATFPLYDMLTSRIIQINLAPRSYHTE